MPTPCRRFTKATGLYPTCAWDERTVKKLILDGKVAPRLVGVEQKYQVRRLYLCHVDRAK
jgi:hypothetical protein